MSTTSFFEEQREQSLIKTTIVEKYFNTWASIITQTQKRHPDRGIQKIAYIDLFAGPGRYKDGTISTPVKILKHAIRSDDFRERLVTPSVLPHRRQVSEPPEDDVLNVGE